MENINHPKHKGPKMPPNASPDSIPDIKTGNDLLKIILIIRRPKTEVCYI